MKICEPLTNQVFGHPLEALRSVIDREISERKSRYEKELAECEAVLSDPSKYSDGYLTMARQTQTGRARNLINVGDSYKERFGEIKNLYEVFGPNSVLLPIPFCKKGPKTKGWSHTKFTDTCTEVYAQGLLHGNVGILQGPESGHLVSVDVDSNNDFKEFLSLNPNLSSSVITMGSRGGNLWLRMKGPYPRLTALKKTSCGEKWGEFRAEGGQTVVHGRHPSFIDYRIISKREPKAIIECTFDNIVWPDYVVRGESSRPLREPRVHSDSVMRQAVGRIEGRKSSNRLSETDCLKERFDLAQFVLEVVPGAYPHSNGVMISCPFHDEKSPSCFVQRDHFYCFGCQEFGDAFALIMKVFKLRFPKAFNLVRGIVERGLMGE